MTEGSTLQFTATETPMQIGLPAITWSSSNPLVATIDASGLASSSTNTGSTTITANEGGEYGISISTTLTVE